MARRHRDDGPTRTQTGREVGVYAPGTCKTDRAGNGSQLFPGLARLRIVMPPRAAFSQDFSPGAVQSALSTRLPARAFTRRHGTSRRERRHPLARYEFAPRHVIDARYLGDYKVWLEFNDGRKGVVDLADELHGEELEPLRDRDRFSEFYLDYGLASIAWLDGQDFTPEFLYDKLKAMN
jgi:hypothetical protein